MNQANQNREDIISIENRLVDGLNAQEHLIDEIHDLQVNERTLKRLVVALAVAVALSLAATGLSIYATQRANDAIVQVDIVRGGGGKCHHTHEQ